jgi:hypothetical protein
MGRVVSVVYAAAFGLTDASTHLVHATTNRRRCECRSPAAQILNLARSDPAVDRMTDTDHLARFHNAHGLTFHLSCLHIALTGARQVGLAETNASLT